MLRKVLLKVATIPPSLLQMMIAAAAISVESQFSYDKALRELTISQKIAPYPKIFGLFYV